MKANTKSYKSPRRSARKGERATAYGPRKSRIGDHELLVRRDWPVVRRSADRLRVVDLFAGAGGMSLGLYLAAARLGMGFEVALAVEMDAAIASVYRKNFERFLAEGGSVHTSSVESLFDGELGSARLTASERHLRKSCQDVSIVVGGPPCQGNSDLNNHTRRSDSRNQLYERAVRAAEVLRPEVIVIENVPPVVHDRGGVVERAESVLLEAGYIVQVCVLGLDRLGAPQRRRRHLMLAIHGGDEDQLRAATALLAEGTIAERRTVRWAIEDLHDKAEEPGSGGFDASSKPSRENSARLDWFARHKGEWILPDRERPPCHRNGGHSYKSIYGRMRWDEPCQTITTGFGSMGQGCYVHPGHTRTITPHEAARLQTFPDFYDFGDHAPRNVWARAIGNAVPPFAMREVVEVALRARGRALDPLAESR